MKQRVRVLVLGGVLAVATLGAAAYWTLRRDHDPETARAPAASPLPPNCDLADAAGVADSPWLAAESKRFRDWLAQAPADVLVVPFQVNGCSVDAAERLALANRVATFLRAERGHRVADPLLVARALGEGGRHYSAADIESLARAVSARYVVVGRIGHDLRKYVIDLELWTAPPSSGGARSFVRQTRSLSVVPLRRDQAPHTSLAPLSEALDSMLPERGSGEPPAPAAGSVAAVKSIPKLQSQLLAPAFGDVETVERLQLLASLFPMEPERHPRRAWLRSLDLAYTLPETEPRRRVLIARALGRLGQRRAALAVLGTARTAEEQAVEAVLNGNLPELSAVIPKLESVDARITAAIEARELRMVYDRTDPQGGDRLRDALPFEGSAWRPIVARRFAGGGARFPVSALADLAAELQAVLPLAPTEWDAVGDRIAGIVRADEARDESAAALGLSAAALEQIHEWTTRQGPTLVAESSGRSRITWQCLDLLAAHAEVPVLQEAELTLVVQRRFDAVARQIALFERYFDGHPELTALKAQHAWLEYDRRQGAAKERWLAAALRDTEHAFRWGGGVTRLVDWAAYPVSLDPAVVRSLQPWHRAYFWEWPASLGWLPRELRHDPRAWVWYRENAAARVTHEHEQIRWILDNERDPRQRAALLAAVDGRFAGSDFAGDRRTASALASGDEAAAETALRQAIAAAPGSFSGYDKLAELLAAQGRYREAFDVYNEYPGFKGGDAFNSIEMSNYASSAGSLFWRVGQFDFALPFYRLSAETRTGSAASLNSEASLAVYRGDFETAARISMAQARRYADIDALDQYFELAFVNREGPGVWRVFEEVRRDGNGGRVIQTIALGVRREGWTDARVLEWLRSQKVRGLATGTFRYAPRAAFAALTVDRVPPPDLAQIIKNLQPDAPYRRDPATGRTVAVTGAPIAQGEPSQVCGPSRFDGGASLAGPPQSHIVLFAAGYDDFVRGDWDRAHRQFVDIARRYEFFDHKCEHVAYVLPYLAYAAAKIGKSQAVMNYLDGVVPVHRLTHYHLARAILAGASGDHRAAQASLDQAIHRWESDNYRVVSTRYLYAEVCRWLFEDSRDEGYRERLLNWARISTRRSPGSSWATALVAKYARDGTERQQATEALRRLDPGSATLAAIDRARS